MKLFWSVFTFAFIFSNASLAQKDDHSNFPQDAILILEGYDPIKRSDCFLFVTSVEFEGGEVLPSRMVVKAQTSFKHGKDQAPSFEIRQVSGKENMMSGQVGRSQLAVEFQTADLDFALVKEYSVRWMHGNHFDNGKCLNLKEHKD